MSDEEPNLGLAGMGCLTVIGLIIWGVWALFTSCLICNENWLTKSCARAQLEATCGSSQDIGDVDEINETSAKGQRQLLYVFQKRPQPGAIVSTEHFRGISYAYWDKQKDAWIAFCAD